MGEGVGLYRDLKESLEQALRGLLEYLVCEQRPPAEECRWVEELLQKYAEAQSCHVPDFAEKHRIRVTFSDVSENRTATGKTTMSQDPAFLLMLHRLGMRKLWTGTAADRMLPQWRSLLDLGCIASVSIEGPKTGGEYYTLSSQGWACLERKNLYKTVKKQTGKSVYTVPETMMLRTGDRTALNFIRAAMLEKFYGGEKSYLSFLYPKSGGILLGAPIDNSTGACYSCPAIFNGEPAPSQISLLRELIDSEQVEQMTFLTVSAEDCAALQKSLGRQASKKVNFYVLEASDGRER